MFNVKHYLPKNYRLHLYYTLFHPHLINRTSDWSATFSTYLIPLQTLHNIITVYKHYYLSFELTGKLPTNVGWLLDSTTLRSSFPSLIIYINRLCVLYYLSACEVDAINVELHASGSSDSTSMTARCEQNTECCSFSNGQLLRVTSWEIEPGLILTQILQETECHTTTGRPFQQWTTTTIRITSGGVALCYTGVAAGGTGTATPLI